MDFEIQEEQVKAEIIKSVRGDARLKNLSLRETSVFMIIVSALSRAILFIVNPVLKSVYESIFIQTSNQYNLERRLLQEGLPGFRPAAKSETNIRMGTKRLPQSSISIPQGLIVKTPGDEPIEFELLKAGLLTQDTPPDTNGHYTVLIPARSVLRGSLYNLRAESLTELDEEIEGVDVVTNPEPATGGREEETIESVRQRLLDKRTGQVIGLLDWFKSQAESIDGVSKAHIVTRYQDKDGQIGILIIASGGAAPKELIDKVQKHFDAPERNPAGAWHPIVATLTERSQDFTLTAFYEPGGFEPDEEDVKRLVRQYINTLEIGSDIVLSRLSSSLILGLSLRDVRITEPTSNVAIPVNELAVVGDITVQIQEFVDT